MLERETQRGAAREHVMKAKALFVLAVEDYHASAGAGEHSEIVSKLLRLDGSGVEPCADTRERVGRPFAFGWERC